jgi:drug/metabolite transporter (DMT)-like permease
MRYNWRSWKKLEQNGTVAVSRIWKGEIMTLHSLISKVTRFFSWLYYEQEWERWELIGIAVLALAILIVVRRYGKAKARRAMAHHGEGEKHWRGT